MELLFTSRTPLRCCLTKLYSASVPAHRLRKTERVATATSKLSCTSTKIDLHPHHEQRTKMCNSHPESIYNVSYQAPQRSQIISPTHFTENARMALKNLLLETVQSLSAHLMLSNSKKQPKALKDNANVIRFPRCD